MSPNSDNAMARFLFAILKQKNLRDIDWNQVAQDPVLLQPITNGHAARMRYSRFRSTVTGHEPQKRSRHGEKARVSKSKKDHQSIKGTIIKSESGASLSSYAQYSPSSDASPYMGDTRDDFRARFLTPCSDDMTQAMSVRPAAVENTASGFLTGTDASPDFLNHAAHSPAFSAFDAAYDLSRYSTGSDFQSQDISDLSATQSLMDCDQDWNDLQLF
ncbi:hypothetical protein TOPH_01098 [Tolypocladium ophioglossoides CBS 100239]|uniref:Myb-like DNA-binding domain-containing protein n=1 Tax=Tolypocladium ophioglossoides (strain CBS 100239) TaxID=1163406 RepID=A0A0L0NKC1_TOLOC|nr:hypothetical protein TOPH_01098 [Tolypocladium ophioglossoides CBS 100239]